MTPRAAQVVEATPRGIHRVGLTGARRGQAMMEFIMVAPLYFLLIFGVIDFARMFFVQINVQQAVQEAARYASTGNHMADPTNPGQNLSRVASITAYVQQM
ncbi:MAG TPA: TadE family protein, partial [Candidatus Binataceae bacterium]|nr:TadE family protein [Candidatus Binataceae bacterium]